MVERAETGVTALTEDGEEILVIEGTYAGELELVEGDLARVEIDGMDARRPGQRVVEHVATGTGDDQQLVVGADIEHLAIDGRVFPAGVVDQGVRMQCVEEAVVEGVCARSRGHRGGFSLEQRR